MAENKENIIVALELGTSRISGIAGKKVNGNMQILAYAEEQTTNCIKRGIVYNIDQTTQCIKNVIEKLQQTLGKTISQVYVGLGGQSVRSIRSKVATDLLTQAYITTSHIDELRRKSYDIPYPNCERLATIVQGYTVDGIATEEPVGVMGTKIEGEYLNIIARHQLRSNIETCFNNTNVSIADTRLSAYELAENVLTDQDKRAGSVLIDLGAGTTTVVIYTNNILRHLVTLPIGMANITQDLTALNVEPAEAEQIKLKYGNAHPDDNDESAELMAQTYTTSFGQTHKVAEIQQVIEARLTEIIKNVENQIQKSDYGYKEFIGGIVLTGGGSNMKNIEKVFADSKLKIEKVRIARTLNQPVIKNSTVTNLSIDSGMAASIISLLMSGEENCVGERFNGKDMFRAAEADEKIGEKQQREQEEAKAEAEAVERLETYKNAIRDKITELEHTLKDVKENGKDGKLRKRASEKADDAESIQDDDYKKTIELLEQKDKYKQTVKEAKELGERLAKSADNLKEAVEKAKKDNSPWRKFLNTLGDLADD